MMRQVAVIGAGSWGTTLANLLAKKGHPVRLWSYENDVAEAINRSRENPRYLPQVRLDDRIEATDDVRAAVDDVPVVVNVTPSQHVRRVMGEAAGSMEPGVRVVSASKGLEIKTLETMAQVLEDVLPERAAVRASFISGPSFAVEVAREEPTAVVVASTDADAAADTQRLFQTDYFRVYTNPDVRGVELGGALKNVIALASGMVSGLGLGHNTRAALITRGLAEISRLGVALGANALTFSGLAGMGDLILTCTGDLSRNRRVGMALGRGGRLETILEELGMVAEGVETARAARELAHREGVEMPIVEQVCAVLFEGRDVREAVDNLMLREPKAERWS
ncbi:MAG: NAD(P)H-dependent glycerol-3-phosphate dehydrogenase [Gemmatimonadota bacterium]